MYQRTRRRVDERTSIPSSPPPSRPSQTSLSKTRTGDGPAGEEADGQVMRLEGVYIISVAARILDMHPQTLRKYERLGLINPGRTIGMLRLYSLEDIRRVRLIRHLGSLGLNLAGIEFALTTAENLLDLKRRLTATATDGTHQAAIEQELARVFRNLNLPWEE